MNQLIRVEAGLPSVSGKITGRDLDIQSRITNELDLWNGLNEHSPIVKETLDLYWEPYWWDDNPNIPWSAVFISWLVRDQGFTGSPQHLQYVKNVIEGKSPGWKAYSIPKNQGRIQLNVGDILVKPRSGSDTATHGDIVYRVENGEAILVGGNVSDTAKIIGSLKVTPEGIIAQPISQYLVILKKKPILPIPQKAIIPLIAIGLGGWFLLSKT